MGYRTEVRPTRAGLSALKNHLRIARRAHQILSMKLDGMMMEVIRLVPEVKEEHDHLMKRYTRTRNLIAAAYMIEGMAGMTMAAYSVEVRPEVTLGERNLFGVTVPVISATGLRTDLTERGYGLLATSLVIDDLADAYQDLITAIIRYAGNESTLRHLLREIERTGRRVRALEYQVIPQLEESHQTITRIRDEIEREESNRLFYIKKRKEEEESGTGELR